VVNHLYAHHQSLTRPPPAPRLYTRTRGMLVSRLLMYHWPNVCADYDCDSTRIQLHMHHDMHKWLVSLLARKSESDVTFCRRIQNKSTATVMNTLCHTTEGAHERGTLLCWLLCAYTVQLFMFVLQHTGRTILAVLIYSHS
jgi:hypothetical protein